MGDFVHINHFSPKSLSGFLQNRGFEVLENRYTRAEIWDLTQPGVKFQALVRRWARNHVVEGVSLALGGLSRMGGIECGLNFSVLARKKT